MKPRLTASSMTDCNAQAMFFQDLGSRQVVADFSGGTLSSEGGALFLPQVDNNLGLTLELARCFEDRRDARFVDYALEQMLAQRFTVKVWATKTSTISNGCVWTRCWPRRAIRRILWGWIG